MRTSIVESAEPAWRSHLHDRCSEDETNGENEAFLLAKTELQGFTNPESTYSYMKMVTIRSQMACVSSRDLYRDKNEDA